MVVNENRSKRPGGRNYAPLRLGTDGMYVLGHSTGKKRLHVLVNHHDLVSAPWANFTVARGLCGVRGTGTFYRFLVIKTAKDRYGREHVVPASAGATCPSCLNLWVARNSPTFEA